jgi:hypothetical protein
MPLMCRKEGKVTKIVEKIMGTPPNQHKAHINSPQIREKDMQRVLLMLGMGGMPNPDPGNNQMPQQ